MNKTSGINQLHGVGRRKSAVARVWLTPGKGKVEVNGKGGNEYFPMVSMQEKLVEPLVVANCTDRFDIMVNVVGGGLFGQADATRLGVARALLLFDEALRPVLKKGCFLRVDSRVKERKKYGQRGARRKFQFVKR